MDSARRSRNRIVLVVVLVLVIEPRHPIEDEDENEDDEEKFARRAKILRDSSTDRGGESTVRQPPGLAYPRDCSSTCGTRTMRLTKGKILLATAIVLGGAIAFLGIHSSGKPTLRLTDGTVLTVARVAYGER